MSIDQPAPFCWHCAEDVTEGTGVFCSGTCADTYWGVETRPGAPAPALPRTDDAPTIGDVVAGLEVGDERIITHDGQMWTVRMIYRDGSDTHSTMNPLDLS